MAPPFITPKHWIESGVVKNVKTLEGLTHQCGIKASNLMKTVRHFNPFALQGKDPDFHRGEGHFGLFYGDKTQKSNASLEAIDKAPY